MSWPTNRPVGGENIDQRMFWATPAMMKRLMPLPRPQPFWTSSSINMTIMPAEMSCMNIANITPMPSSGKVPYMPLRMYAPAWTAVRRMLKTLLAEVKSPLSSGFDKSHFMMFEPASNCRIKPAVTIGPMPSSINVPWFEAKMTRSDPKLSCAPAAYTVQWDFGHHQEDD